MKVRWVGTPALAMLAVLTGSGSAVAQDGGPPVVISDLDTLWVLLAATLVFFMQAGFALLEAGLQSARNVINILMKNVADFTIAAMIFWAIGFGLMFGAGNSLVGMSGWFLGGGEGTFDSLAWARVPLEAKFFFQLVFAGTAATIVSGAIGGRVKFSTYLVLSLVLTGLIYPLIGHWIWGGGWLAEMGFFDFAGSTVVHAVGGFAALAGALVVGPRIGKYGLDGRPRAMPGHNMTLAALGTFILWFGWFGFNPGSTMALDAVAISHIFVTTNIAAAAGALAAMGLSWRLFGKSDISMTLNGALAGLVSITAPCAFVGVGSAALIGLIGGLVVVLAVLFFDRARIDDPVGAISVHGICGVWGTVSIGLFASAPYAGGEALPGLGFLFGGGVAQLQIQLLGTVVASAVAFTLSFALFSILKATIGVRVSPMEEITGLDVAEHGNEAYSTAHPIHRPTILTPAAHVVD